MTRSEKIESLEKLVKELSPLEDPETYHREFWAWRQKAMRRIVQIFENHSLQVNHFVATKYLQPSLSAYQAYYGDSNDAKSQVSEVIKRFISYIGTLIEEVPNDSISQINASIPKSVKKVFISHSSKDEEIAKEVTNLLEAVGIPSSQIFNSSMPGYGVKPGEDWVQTLKSTISSEGVVISLISPNYYKSEVSLCEMGATWVLSKTHFPIIVPPMTFRKIKGIIPTTHGIVINNADRWSELKGELEKIFGLDPIPVAKWGVKNKDILQRIEQLLPKK